MAPRWASALASKRFEREEAVARFLSAAKRARRSVFEFPVFVAGVVSSELFCDSSAAASAFTPPAFVDSSDSGIETGSAVGVDGWSSVGNDNLLFFDGGGIVIDCSFTIVVGFVAVMFYCRIIITVRQL